MNINSNALKIVLTFIMIISMYAPFSLSAQNTVRTVINSSSPGRTDLSVPIKDNDNETYMPVTIIKGAEPGRTFTIIAGIHGYEYPPIIAVQEILNEIDYTRLKGNLIIVPVANVASFYARTPFINPIDNKNLNNVFPGKQYGSITEQIAYHITHDIIPISDVFLDIHAGDANEDLLPFICYYDRTDSPEETRYADRLCRVSGFENIVSYTYNITSEQPALYAFKQAVQDGKVALSIESGKLGNVQNEAVSQTKTAIYNMLHEMDMYTTETHRTTQVSHNFFNKQAYVKSTCQGIFYSDYASGDVVSKDEFIGYMTDIFGNKLQEIIAPVTGTILYKIGTPPVNNNETMFCIGYKE